MPQLPSQAYLILWTGKNFEGLAGEYCQSPQGSSQLPQGQRRLVRLVDWQWRVEQGRFERVPVRGSSRRLPRIFPAPLLLPDRKGGLSDA